MDVLYDLFNATMLAIIEGITEFLPISSTGHLIIAEQVFPLRGDKTFQDTFLVVIQFPAILAVLLYFQKKLLLPSKDWDQIVRWFNLWLKIAVAFVPAGIIGFLLDDVIEYYLFNPLTVSIALVIGGIVLIVIENWFQGRQYWEEIAEVSFLFALGVGLIQCMAMIPGVSRSAATIIGALLLGATRQVSVEFSFFLAIPTLAGAGCLKLFKHGLYFTPKEWILLIWGSLVSFLIAYAVIAFFLNYVRNHRLALFGYYRILFGIGLIFLLIFFR